MTGSLADARRIAAALTVEQDRAVLLAMTADRIRGALLAIVRKESALCALGISSIPEGAEPRAPDLPPAPSWFDPDIGAVVERLLRRKAEDGVGKAQQVQIRAVMRLFVDAVGETDVRAITQAHLASFRDIMSRLPKSHGKSERTRGLPVAEIIEAARALPAAKVGLSPATVNRNLEIVRQVLRSAQTEGIPVVEGIDPARLRRKDTVRARDKRTPFSLDDCREIFRQPVWTGCRSEARRRIAGCEIIRDGLFWIPIIAAYTGARREEIAGLELGDIDYADGSWVFRIRPNESRPSLKTASSVRVIPSHRDLVRLGFFADLAGRDGRGVGEKGGEIRASGKESWRREGARSTRVFPDLHRKHAAAGWGEAIAYTFDKILDDALGTARTGKSFHSFRHYVTDQLRKSGVPKEVRLDILGHAGEDLEDETYGSSSTILDMQAAIDLLPSVITV